MLEAFDTLFNKRDYEAAAGFWSENYIQHMVHIEPGRDGLFDLIRSAPDTLRYEHQLILAEGYYVIAHGRFTGNGRPVAWIAADVVRIEDGRLAEHWDVLQDEVTETELKSGRPTSATGSLVEFPSTEMLVPQNRIPNICFSETNIRFCEGFRMPAHHERRAHARGRRPKASREGTRGMDGRGARALWGFDGFASRAAAGLMRLADGDDRVGGRARPPRVVLWRSGCWRAVDFGVIAGVGRAIGHRRTLSIGRRGARFFGGLVMR